MVNIPHLLIDKLFTWEYLIFVIVFIVELFHLIQDEVLHIVEIINVLVHFFDTCVREGVIRLSLLQLDRRSSFLDCFEAYILNFVIYLPQVRLEAGLALQIFYHIIIHLRFHVRVIVILLDILTLVILWLLLNIWGVQHMVFRPQMSSIRVFTHCIRFWFLRLFERAVIRTSHLLSFRCLRALPFLPLIPRSFWLFFTHFRLMVTLTLLIVRLNLVIMILLPGNYVFLLFVLVPSMELGLDLPLGRSTLLDELATLAFVFLLYDDVDVTLRGSLLGRWLVAVIERHAVVFFGEHTFTSFIGPLLCWLLASSLSLIHIRYLYGGFNIYYYN